MAAPLLLLAAAWAAWRIHVRWGQADLRRLELRSAPEIWDEIAEQESQDGVAALAACALRRPWHLLN